MILSNQSWSGYMLLVLFNIIIIILLLFFSLAIKKKW